MPGDVVKTVTLGTRGSLLAVEQSRSTEAFLQALGFEVRWKAYTTHGDSWQSGHLAKADRTGLFTRELELALLEGEVDLLIHSFKDVPLERPEGIVTACVPKREDPSDLLITRPGLDWDAPHTLGTSSVRRERMLKKVFPNANFTWIRGNVPTRIQRVREGYLREEVLHGTLLATAGVNRLNLDLSDLSTRHLSYDELLPAPAQGALLLEARANHLELLDCLKAFHDAATERAVRLERGVLKALGGGCQLPLGCLAQEMENGHMRLRAAFDVDGELRFADETALDEGELPTRCAKKLME